MRGAHAKLATIVGECAARRCRSGVQERDDYTGKRSIVRPQHYTVDDLRTTDVRRSERYQAKKTGGAADQYASFQRGFALAQPSDHFVQTTIAPQSSF